MGHLPALVAQTLIPASNMEISLQPGNMQTSASDPQQVVFATGRVDPIIMSDIIKLPTITALPLRFISDSRVPELREHASDRPHPPAPSAQGSRPVVRPVGIPSRTNLT